MMMSHAEPVIYSTPILSTKTQTKRINNFKFLLATLALDKNPGDKI